MIRDHAQGHVSLDALTIVRAGNVGHLIGNIHYRVHIEQGVHILADHRQALQSHTGIDIFFFSSV